MMRDSDDVHDQELRQVAQRLGAAAADRLDVERTAQAVLARLRAGDAATRSPIQWMQPAWMRAAAVVVVLLGAGLLTYYRLHHPSTGPSGIDSKVTGPAVGELADVSPSQLQDVLAALNDPIDTSPVVHAGEAGVEDLSGPELQSLLRAMEDY
jgi:hypothetical protein